MAQYQQLSEEGLLGVSSHCAGAHAHTEWLVKVEMTTGRPQEAMHTRKACTHGTILFEAC